VEKMVTTTHCDLAVGAEADSYARATCGSSANYESFPGDAVRRTDGRARRLMMESAMHPFGIHLCNPISC